MYAEVAKLVDAPALGADGVTHGSSSLPLGTKNKHVEVQLLQHKNILLFCEHGETWTPNPYGMRFWDARVYQFRHMLVGLILAYFI